ncbi:MAG: AmmeMemoRadiSam system radical SAM enzyme [Deltaproteobacteria bacterium]|nr:MAG: AmmeMemoRadiSam system radical SAM enzyme [Deltaproteobacteria bacterium]
MREAKYYHKEEAGEVKCLLCPQGCRLVSGEKGKCLVRENQGGTLYALTYGKVAAIQMDPIEKKPLYHFYPGQQILSLGAIGCNLSCQFCQNYHLVEGKVPMDSLTPEQAVRLARDNNSVGIAYTYNEPLIQFEYVLDTAKMLKEEGLNNVLVTNGLINPKPLEELLPFIDAMNIDLKSIREEFYQELCGGFRDPVLKNIERSNKVCHIELTNLLVTETNDSIEELRDLVDYVASLDQDIPVHFSRYSPQYKMSKPPTPVEKLMEAYKLARERLNYVYLGNLWTEEGSNTYCPKCKSLLIRRQGYSTSIIDLKGKCCQECGQEVRIIN